VVRPNIDPLTGEEESHELEERKEELRAAGRAVDPLKPLRDHPYLTVATAAALGASAASPAAAEWLWTTFKGGMTRAAVKFGREILSRHMTHEQPQTHPDETSLPDQKT
jgi:hypothetical protein